jgi:hypothetical protein
VQLDQAARAPGQPVPANFRVAVPVDLLELVEDAFVVLGRMPTPRSTTASSSTPSLGTGRRLVVADAEDARRPVTVRRVKATAFDSRLNSAS